MSVYSLPTVPAKLVRCSQRDKLRELRKWLMQLWRRQRPGSRRRELTRGLVAECDRLLRREVSR